MRIGFGYDVHPLVKGRRLFLGGIEIPSELGLAGYSDGDVLLHAICDALLGAIGQRDIGVHFPEGDPRWRDISSIKLLESTYRMVVEGGWELANLDSTVVLERPRIDKYIPAMREGVAKKLMVEPARVNIKATTGEGLGFIGKEEGAAAYAVVLLTQP